MATLVGLLGLLGLQRLAFEPRRFTPRVPRHWPVVGLLEPEEVAALAGVWAVRLDLDDGVHRQTWRLRADGRLQSLGEEAGACNGAGWRWWMPIDVVRMYGSTRMQCSHASVAYPTWSCDLY